MIRPGFDLGRAWAVLTTQVDEEPPRVVHVPGASERLWLDDDPPTWGWPAQLDRHGREAAELPRSPAYYRRQKHRALPG